MKSGNPTGRPTLLTPELQERFLESVRLGLIKVHRCAYTGISRETLRQWELRAERGNKADQPYVDFVGAVMREEAALIVRLNAVQLKAAMGDSKAGIPSDWRAASDLRKAIAPEYGKQPIEISGPDGGAIVIKGYTSITPDDWQAPAERQDDSDV